MVRPGELLSALMMVTTDVIAMRHEEEEFGRLAPGGFFSETELLAGIGEAYALEAPDTRDCLGIGAKAGFCPLLINRPAVAELVALSLSRRAPTDPGRRGPGSSRGAERARLPEGNPDDFPPLDQDKIEWSCPAPGRTLRPADSKLLLATDGPETLRTLR